jgi:hypothetical protein
MPLPMLIEGATAPLEDILMEALEDGNLDPQLWGRPLKHSPYNPRYSGIGPSHMKLTNKRRRLK